MNSVDQIVWVEKHRPHKVQDCILPQSIKKIFQSYVDKGEIPHLLLSGSPGAGKTSIARAMCEEVGLDYIFISGSEESGIDVLRTKIRQYASTVSLSGGRKVIIIDEADYMNVNSLQPALRTAIEEFSKNCSFIFTCNYKNRIMSAIHDRCACIDFVIPKAEKAELAGKFMISVENILTQENILYDRDVIAAVITKYFPSFRKTLNELQKYSNITGKIDVGILSEIAELDIKDLVKSLKAKDFLAVKKWVSNNSDNDPNFIYRKIYDSLYTILKPESIPQAVLIIAKYSWQAMNCPDPEIQLLACCTELMVECEWS